MISYKYYFFKRYTKLGKRDSDKKRDFDKYRYFKL